MPGKSLPEVNRIIVLISSLSVKIHNYTKFYRLSKNKSISDYILSVLVT